MANGYELEMHLRDKYDTYDLDDSRGLASSLFINNELSLLPTPKSRTYAYVQVALFWIQWVHMESVLSGPSHLIFLCGHRYQGEPFRCYKGHTFDDMCHRLSEPNGFFWAYLHEAGIWLEWPTQMRWQYRSSLAYKKLKAKCEKLSWRVVRLTLMVQLRPYTSRVWEMSPTNNRLTLDCHALNILSYGSGQVLVHLIQSFKSGRFGGWRRTLMADSSFGEEIEPTSFSNVGVGSWATTDIEGVDSERSEFPWHSSGTIGPRPSAASFEATVPMIRFTWSDSLV